VTTYVVFAINRSAKRDQAVGALTTMDDALKLVLTMLKRRSEEYGTVYDTGDRTGYYVETVTDGAEF
jgi:hypothetical protein